jgi:hypothetical protein
MKKLINRGGRDKDEGVDKVILGKCKVKDIL